MNCLTDHTIPELAKLGIANQRKLFLERDKLRKTLAGYGLHKYIRQPRRTEARKLKPNAD